MMVQLSLTLAVLFTVHTGVSIAWLEKNDGSERIDTPSQYTKLETHHMEKRSGRFRSGGRKFGNIESFSTRSFKDPFTNSFRRSFKVFRKNRGNNIKLDIFNAEYETNSNRRTNVERLSGQNPYVSPFFKQRNYGPLLHDGPLSTNQDPGSLPIGVIGRSPGLPGSDGLPRLPISDGLLVVDGFPGIDGGIAFDPGEQLNTGIVKTPGFPIKNHIATDHGMATNAGITNYPDILGHPAIPLNHRYAAGHDIAIDPYLTAGPYMAMDPVWTMNPYRGMNPNMVMYPDMAIKPAKAKSLPIWK